MRTAKSLTSVIAAGATVTALTIVSTSGPAGASPRAGWVPLPGSAVPFTVHTRATGDVPGSTLLTIQVWLRPRLAAAQRFATAASTPGSRLFRHYLSPRGYTARYGATRAQAGAVASWLHASGFTGIRTDSQRNYVQATATVAKINAAFRVRLRLYRASGRVSAGPYRLRANDRPIIVPARLAGLVLGVTGLDNAAPVPLFQQPGGKPGHWSFPRRATSGFSSPCSHYYGQHEVNGLPERFGTTSFPTENCGYSAGQMRSVYSANWRNTGKGQTIALVELGLTRQMFHTLQLYAAANHMPAPSPQRYSELSLGAGSACGDPFNIEEQLDVEASYDMAPGANQLVVGGDSCNNGFAGLQALFDADTAILSGNGRHPLASVASNSWEGFDETQPALVTNIEHAYLVRAAAEGVGMYFSSGDAPGVRAPSSDPFATAVGGTTLGIDSNGGRLFETGWSTGIAVLAHHHWLGNAQGGAAGGGPSLLWKQPAYQRHVVPAALARAPGNRGGLVRSVPDISADADPFTGFDLGVLEFHKNKPPTYIHGPIGGTSLAAPLVAGMVTAAQQGHRWFGFLNPVFYGLARTGAISATLPLTSNSPALYRGVACSARDCFFPVLAMFDVQQFAMDGYAGQVTLPGYDNMTGVGTPNGQQFITALRHRAR